MPALAAIVLTLAVRHVFLSWPLTVDEGSYAYVARWWFRGLKLYSHELWSDRPQAIFLAYAAGMKLIGTSVTAIRMWSCLWAAGTALAVYLTVTRMCGERAGWIALVLHCLFSASPHVEGFTANAEAFMVLPATLSAWCLLKRNFAWAGLLGSVAFLLKPSGIAAVLLGLVWLTHTRGRLRDWAAFVMALLPIPMISVVHAAFTVGASRYIDAVVMYRLGLNLATRFQLEGLAFDGWLRAAPVLAPLLPLAFLGTFRQLGHNRTFLLAWLVTSVLGMAVGGNWWMHYFVQLVPALTAAAGIGVVLLLSQSSVLPLAAVLPFSLLGFLLFSEVELPYFSLDPAEALERLYHRPEYTTGQEAAQYLRQHASPTDTLYVAFYQADVCYLSGLRSSSPYLFRLDVDHRPGAFEEVLADITSRKPTYVLDLKQPLNPDKNLGDFHKALAAGFSAEQQFAHGTLYKRKN